MIGRIIKAVLAALILVSVFYVARSDVRMLRGTNGDAPSADQVRNMAERTKLMKQLEQSDVIGD